MKDTDVIVKGRLSAPHAYLSKDQLDVHTEYEIEDPEYLYMAKLSKPTLPSPTSVSLKGGSVTIDGLTYSATYEALPLPDPGMECLLLLRWFEDRYYLVGLFNGLFSINNGRLKQLGTGPEFLTDYQNVEASKAIESIVARRLQIGQ